MTTAHRTTQGANLRRFAAPHPEPRDDVTATLDAHFVDERLQQRLADRSGPGVQRPFDAGTQCGRLGVECAQLANVS